MEKTIERQIIEEVKYRLSELDIEGMVSAKEIKAKVSREIDRFIADKVTEALQTSLVEAILKQQPIIDAWTADKVRQVMGKVENDIAKK